MAQTRVYYFQRYDIMADKMVCSKRPATLERIKRLGPEYEPLMATEELIEEAELDDGFRRRPTPAETTALLMQANKSTR